MSSPSDIQPLWSPTQEEIERANMTLFAREVISTRHLNINTWDDFYQWSVTDIRSFWDEVWNFCHVIGDKGERILEEGPQFFDAQWFPDARLNYAENMLRFNDDGDAVVFYNEQGYHSRLSWKELNIQVKCLAQQFQQWGIQPGDRIVAVVPNMPEAVVCYLASAAIGAIFSSCSPDFGVPAIIDRFGQLEPAVLIITDGYYFKGEKKDIRAHLPEITAQLPTLKHIVFIPYISTGDTAPSLPCPCHLYSSLIHTHSSPDFHFTRFPFNHPLTILFSSGTTGKPKCIIHGAGGTLIQHMKEHILHADLCAEDKLYFYTTTSWMMWNWLISGLATGATIMLFDGNPTHQRCGVIFDYIKKEKITHFGTSAKFIHFCMKEALSPRVFYALDQEEQLRMILSTGSPLSPEGFRYVYSHIKKQVCLASSSGGTDIISCFVGGNPILPVYAGELQCRALGMAVEVWNSEGKAVVDQKGELVCVKPFPCMPVGFWGDSDRSMYHDSYFSTFENVWTHGDFSELTSRGSFIIYGRSDNTLKPSGVRIGTAELYRALDNITEIVEPLATNYPVENDISILLLVQMKEGVVLTPEWIERIKNTIRQKTTARHVPKTILQVSDLPRTKTGKLAEKVIFNILHHQTVTNHAALMNPHIISELEIQLQPYCFPK